VGKIDSISPRINNILIALAVNAADICAQTREKEMSRKFAVVLEDAALLSTDNSQYTLHPRVGWVKGKPMWGIQSGKGWEAMNVG
jgi:hypothetical protein